MKYRIIYYRPYLSEPERDEPQRTEVIAKDVDAVLDIYSDCHVTHIEEVTEPIRQTADVANVQANYTAAGVRFNGKWDFTDIPADMPVIDFDTIEEIQL